MVGLFSPFYARITSIQIIDIFLTLLDMSAERVYSSVGLHLGDLFLLLYVRRFSFCFFLVLKLPSYILFSKKNCRHVPNDYNLAFVGEFDATFRIKERLTSVGKATKPQWNRIGRSIVL